MSIRKFLKILCITTNLFFVFFLILVLILMFKAVSINGNYLIVIPMILITFLLIFFFNQFSNHLTHIKIIETGIEVYKPLKFQKIYLEWKEIKGYSVSEICYGRNLYSSNSFIIYSNTKSEIEIISLFNLNFEKVFESIKKHKVTKLGNEPYQTGLWKRKYKF